MESDLKSLVDKGIAYAFNLIAHRYERKSFSDENLPYHNRDHTSRVIRRVEFIASAMNLHEDETQVARLAAGFHDTVIQSEYYIPIDGGMVIRTSNEMHSVSELIKWFLNNGHDRISKSQLRLASKAILVTIADWFNPLSTAIQPFLTPKSHPIVRCLALADLGAAGMDGDYFLVEGDLRFRERNVDIELATIEAKKQSDISQNDQEKYRQRILYWLAIQEKFVMGRRERLEVEMGNLTQQQKGNVRSLFCHFNEALFAVKQAIHARKNESFWYIAKQMGCKTPSL